MLKIFRSVFAFFTRIRSLHPINIWLQLVVCLQKFKKFSGIQKYLKDFISFPENLNFFTTTIVGVVSDPNPSSINLKYNSTKLRLNSHLSPIKWIPLLRIYRDHHENNVEADFWLIHGATVCPLQFCFCKVATNLTVL